MPAFPEVHVGDPLEYETLTVFPLFAGSATGIDYLLSDEALAGGTVTVEEVTESGSVPNLLVDNQANTLVLFLEGEELRGAKQNRVLNTSVLVAGGKTTLPVSCVEQGRWRYKSRHFGSSGSHSSSKMRHILKKSVTSSLHEGRGHSSDQVEVWKEVGRQMSSLSSDSETMAMADTYDSHQNRLSEYRDRLKYVEGAIGLAVAIGGQVTSVDLFDKPTTCRKVWDRLLTGVVMDALEASSTGKRADSADVQQALVALREAPWKQTQAAGAGEEFRAEASGDRQASALTCNGTVVHGSLVLAS
jgi:translation elongation factor P/translation initiation factor 5A